MLFVISCEFQVGTRRVYDHVDHVAVHAVITVSLRPGTGRLEQPILPFKPGVGKSVSPAVHHSLGSSDKSHPWLYQSALRRKRGLRLATKSIAYSDRFCRHLPVPGESLNFSDFPFGMVAQGLQCLSHRF